MHKEGNMLIQIRVPETIKLWVAETAKKLGISVNALILQMLWEKYEEKQKEG